MEKIPIIKVFGRDQRFAANFRGLLIIKLLISES